MKYFIIAGEASGDLHASNLMSQLKKEDSNAEFCFLGGDLMQAQGGRMVKHYRQMAFMGIVAVLKNARTVLRNLSDCKKAIVDFQPDVLILVDYPSFNLRIAHYVKHTLNTKVYYYISPKIWAWKEYRIKEIKRNIDKMFTIFPFETAFYAKHKFAVEYVGNPTVDSVCTRPNQEQTYSQFCVENNLAEKPIIAILAGSRKQEIIGCLPRMIEAGLHFANDYQVVIAGAPAIEPGLYDSILKGQKVSVVSGKTYELLQQAKVAVVNSGTATLETALMGTPEVVVYHVPLGRIGYFVKEIIVRTKFVSLVNIVAEKLVVKELLAHLFTVDNIVAELELILKNETYRQNMLKEYAQMKKMLGEPGAASRAAKKIVGSL